MSDAGFAHQGAPTVPDGAPRTVRLPSRRATFWGAMLVVLGCALLAAQLVPGISWWMLWPLPIAVAGLAQAVSPSAEGAWKLSRALAGATTFLVGLVLLGNTIGIVAWEAWLVFLMLWPVLVIALGISMIGRGTGAQWLRVISRLLVWSALALSVYLAATGLTIGAVGRDGMVLTVPPIVANGRTVNITIGSGDGVPAIQTW